MPTRAQSGGREMAQNIFLVLSIGLLIGACAWIVLPFLAPVTWATMIVVSTWPLFVKIQAALWGKRSLATIVMTLALLLVFVIPATLAVSTIISNAGDIIARVKSLVDDGMPPAPQWLPGVPIVGKQAAAAWEQAASRGPEGLAARLKPHVGTLTLWFVARAGGLGRAIFEILVTVILSVVLYSSGDQAARGVRLFVRRLAGPRGVEAVVQAANAVRSVALGVILTAVVQSILGGVGLAIAGVPAVGILTAIMFILCLAQVGLGIVLLGAAGWLYWSGDTFWAIAMVVWTVIVTTVDNFLRPMLIKMGIDLPLTMVFAGVVGGLVAFGIIGVFIGPAVLAASYTLLKDWVIRSEGPPATEPSDTGESPETAVP